MILGERPPGEQGREVGRLPADPERVVDALPQVRRVRVPVAVGEDEQEPEEHAVRHYLLHDVPHLHLLLSLQPHLVQLGVVHRPVAVLLWPSNSFLRQIYRLNQYTNK